MSCNYKTVAWPVATLGHTKFKSQFYHVLACKTWGDDIIPFIMASTHVEAQKNTLHNKNAVSINTFLAHKA